MAVVALRGVHKSFRTTVAVEDLSFEVPAGSICGFLGPNGAGKSTTLRMLMSILRPDRGEVEVLGGDAAIHKDRIGYLPEERGVYRRMRVTEFLTFVARLKGVSSQGLAARVQRWLERVELPDVGPKRCSELSKGMLQKVQCVAALLHEPDLIILDEPFSGLDPVNADVLQRLVLELRDAGRTVLFCTHVLHQAEALCDRIVLLNRGRKLLDGSMVEVRERFDPRTVVVEYLDDLRPDAIPGVHEIVPLGPTSYELHLQPEVDAQQVLRDVSAAAPVRRVELRRITLEEVFRRLVTEAAP